MELDTIGFGCAGTSNVRHQPAGHRRVVGGLGRLSDLGERRRTIVAALEESAPESVFGVALSERFSFHDESGFAKDGGATRRYQFSAHEETTIAKKGHT